MTFPVTTLAEGSGSGIATPRRDIIRDDVSWRALWAAHAGPGSEAPTVDFESHMAAAAFAGERPDAGHAIAIADARVDGPVLTLRVNERASARGVAAAQLLVSPFHIVTFPRFDGDVRFAEGSVTPTTITSAVPVHRNAEANLGNAATVSSTGLEPNFAAALAYLAGPFSGVLILLVERTSPHVRFHAWQALLGLGGLGLLAVAALVFSFVTLLLSPLAFTTMFRLSEVAAVVWVGVWAWCLVQAFIGRTWKMPVAGRYAERLATRSGRVR